MEQRQATEGAVARSRDGRSLIGSWLPPAVSLVLGLSLLWLAIPRTIAAWFSIEGDAVFGKIWNLPPPTELELKSGAAAFGRAIEWSPSKRRLINLAIIEMTQAQRLQVFAPERAILIETAERHFIEGLSLNPVDGFAWLGLALLRKLRGAPPRQIVVAAMQSLDMAPSMRSLWLPRAELFFEYASSLQQEELLAVRSQLRTIWATHPSFHLPLLVAASSAGNEAMLATAVAGDLGALVELNNLKQQLKAAPSK